MAFYEIPKRKKFNRTILMLNRKTDKLQSFRFPVEEFNSKVEELEREGWREMEDRLHDGKLKKILP